MICGGSDVIGAVRVSIRAHTHTHTHTHEVKSSSGTPASTPLPPPLCECDASTADNRHTRWALRLSHLVQPRPLPSIPCPRPARPSPRDPPSAAAIFLSTPFGAPWQTPHRRRWVATASLSVYIIMTCAGEEDEVWMECEEEYGVRGQTRRGVKWSNTRSREGINREV